MTIITTAQRQKLLENGRSATRRHRPPGLGYVSLAELGAARDPRGLPLESDLHFAPTKTIAAYADLARDHRRIIT